MGIFDKVVESDSIRYSAGIDALMEDTTINDSMYNNLTIEEAVQRMSYENAQNFSAITKAMAFNELATYVNTGAPMVYTEGVLGDIWAKVKAFFVKLWNKIKAVFKRLWMRASSMFMKKSEWTKKYKKEIAKAKVKSYGDSFKFEGYGYTDTSMKLTLSESDIPEKTNSNYGIGDFTDADFVYDLIKEAGKNSQALEAKVKAFKDKDSGDRKDEIRAAVYKNAVDSKATDTSLDSDDFKDKITEKLRGGDDEKDEFDNINEHIRQAETYLLTGYKDFKKGYDKALKKINKKCDDIIKALDKASNEFSKKSDNSDYQHAYNKAHTDANQTIKSTFDQNLDFIKNDDGLTDDEKKQQIKQLQAQYKNQWKKPNVSSLKDYQKTRALVAEALHIFSAYWQDYSSTYTDLMAIWTKEYNQWMNQSQALLMKAINHKKKESEDYHESYDDYEGSYYTESSNSFLNGVELI